MDPVTPPCWEADRDTDADADADADEAALMDDDAMLNEIKVEIVGLIW